jgi:CHRD domain
MGLRRKLATGSAMVAVAGLAVTASVVSAGGRPLSTDLSGAEEAPGPGDANATGEADLTLNQGQGEVCFDLSWTQVDGTVFAAHIHVGDAGSPGPIVIGLFTGTFAGTDEAAGCVSDVDSELIKAIRQNPSAYYVNIHSTVFPGGAVRGQLGD